MQFELGIWDHFERHPGVSLPQQYQEKIELVREAERLGLSHYHVAEHHLSPLNLAPNPSVFLAALAQATSRIRLRAGVYCLPLYHPVRLIQELCMLDNISGGRLDVGVGRGIRAVEHDWFGIPQDEVRPRFEETLAILITGMSTGKLSHQGRFYRFEDLPLDILPIQRPHPPLWYAGGAENAGKGGFNFLGRNPEDLHLYWELWSETKYERSRVNAHLEVPLAGLTKHVVVRESYVQAEAIARRSWPVFEEHWFSTPVLINEEGRAAPLRGSGSRATDFDEALAEDRRLLIGTPSIVRERLEEWIAQVKDRPSFHFSPAVQWGDITSEEARETLHLLARDVLPAFQAT